MKKAIAIALLIPALAACQHQAPKAKPPVKPPAPTVVYVPVPVTNNDQERRIEDLEYANKKAIRDACGLYAAVDCR